MPDLIPLINGASYEWAMITMNVLGIPISGVIAIEYDDNEDIKNIWGAGKYPVSRGGGKYEATAKVTLLMEEVENLQTVAPGGRLQQIPEFTITVTFISGSVLPRVHKINNCRFKNNARKTAQGDSSIPVELELVVSDIKWI